MTLFEQRGDESMLFKPKKRASGGGLSPGNAERFLREEFNSEKNPDLILRRIVSADGVGALLAFVNGMADERKLDEFVIRPLERGTIRGSAPEEMITRITQIAEARLVTDIGKAARLIAEGMSALFTEGAKACVVFETRGFEKRAVGEAVNESVVLGPKESFTESLRTNITLLRRVMKNPALTAEMLEINGAEPTPAALVYINGRTKGSLLEEIRGRVASVDTDTLITSGIVEQLIEDASLLPLPRILSTERPDRAASHILGGSAVLIVDGSPFALVMPVTLFSLMDSPEDVYLRPPLGSVLRVVRYIGALVCVLMPGYFLALALYHQGMLTTEVLSTVIASRQMVFEPIAAEMIILLLIFQLIREAGLRIPGPIGQAIGIIGGLIMGQAAVAAHLASTVVLIIVAASGLGNFCIPDYSAQLAASYFRMAAVIAACLAGLLGVTAALVFAVSVLADTESFGKPYLAPLSPRRSRRRPFIIRGRIGGASYEKGA